MTWSALMLTSSVFQARPRAGCRRRPDAHVSMNASLSAPVARKIAALSSPEVHIPL